jgi:hypothetical protein
MCLNRFSIGVAALASSSAFLYACGAQVADIRMGAPRPAREPACSLDVVTATDMTTIAKYDQVGMVRLTNAEAGSSPMSPEAREIVRPRACAMGGDAISIVASGDIMSPALVTSSYAAYIVWAKKAPAAAPQKF